MQDDLRWFKHVFHLLIDVEAMSNLYRLLAFSVNIYQGIRADNL